MHNFSDYKTKEQQKLDSVLRELNMQIGKLENTLAKQLHDNEIKSNELAAAKKKIEDLNRKRQGAENDSAQIKQANNKLNENFMKYAKECEKQRSDMEDELLTKHGKMNHLKGLCRQKQLDAANLTDETAHITKLISIQDSALRHMHSEQQGLVDEHKSESDKVSKLQTQLLKEEDAQQSLQNRKLNLQNSHDKLTLESASTSSKITELQLKIKELNQQHEIIKTKTNLQSESNRDQQKILDDITAEVEKSKKQLSDLESHYKKLQTNLNGVEESYIANLNELKSLLVTIGKFEVSESADSLDG
mmetsp:Transcript_11859/g.25903  ORF Transcript_11859/g.25903 Transcript_11859/m.25903 type:complete len:304 (-) Transcript_11859:1249-2160(-)